MPVSSCLATMRLSRKPILILLCLGAVVAALPPCLLADIAEGIDKLQDKLPEIKVKETVVSVSPKMRFYLPSGALDLALRQEYERTTVDFSSKYDFVNNFMGVSLDFSYMLSTPLSFGVNLNDRVDFEAIFDNSQYIQRSQSITPYVQYNLAQYTRLRGGLRFENTFTDSVSGQYRLDYGKNIVGEIGAVHDTLSEGSAFPRGSRASLTLQHAFKNLGSDYNYTQAELNLKRYVYIVRDHYLDCQFQAGYPIETENRPLTSIYYAGGYRLLRGYNYKEFQGDALIYGNLTYNVPIIERKQETILGIPLSIVTLDFFIEGAKIGDYSIYNTFSDVKFSAGIGIGYKIILLKKFPLQLELSEAKAFDSRMPLFYFTLSTIYYTWGNE